MKQPDIKQATPQNNTSFTRGKGDGVLFQVSTFEALRNGCYDGVFDFKELSAHGDFGIGTLDRLDGEMIALDGRFYQVTSDGRVHAVTPDMTTPFANVTFFRESLAFEIPAGLDFKGLQRLLDEKLLSRDLFYALRVDGLFSGLELVSAPPAKETPHPKLAEMIKRRKIYNYTQLSGTMAGFYFPPFTQGVNAPGYHLHFLDDARKAGGHVQEILTGTCKVRVAILSRLELALPGP